MAKRRGPMMARRLVLLVVCCSTRAAPTLPTASVPEMLCAGGDAPRVAVCVAGAARTFERALVHESLRENVLRALGADARFFAYVVLRDVRGDDRARYDGVLHGDRDRVSRALRRLGAINATVVDEPEVREPPQASHCKDYKAFTGKPGANVHRLSKHYEQSRSRAVHVRGPSRDGRPQVARGPAPESPEVPRPRLRGRAGDGEALRLGPLRPSRPALVQAAAALVPLGRAALVADAAQTRGADRARRRRRAAARGPGGVAAPELVGRPAPVAEVGLGVPHDPAPRGRAPRGAGPGLLGVPRAVQRRRRRRALAAARAARAREKSFRRRATGSPAQATARSSNSRTTRHSCPASSCARTGPPSRTTTATTASCASPRAAWPSGGRTASG